jgi:hypothetical protein
MTPIEISDRIKGLSAATLLRKVVELQVPQLRRLVGSVRLPMEIYMEAPQWKGDCPFCDAAGVFYLEDNTFGCAACFAYGDLIQFVMDIEDVGFVAAIEWLASGKYV